MSLVQDGAVGVLGIETLTGRRAEHAVVFYRDDDQLAEMVGRYLLPAVQDLAPVLVVATPDHIRSIEARLADAGADLGVARARGLFLVLDAAEAIRGFMIADWPDPAGFWRAITPLLREAARARRPVRVYGEMVALLWEADLVSAAIEVEAMWNELTAQYDFSLLCGYSQRSVGGDGYLDDVTEVCRLHTHVIGAPPGAGIDSLARSATSGSWIDQPLSSPPADAVVLRYRADLAYVREFAAVHGRQAGLPPHRVNDLILAVGELTANTLAHTSGPGTLTLWVTGTEVVCQIQDQGQINAQVTSRTRPDAAALDGGRGLWLVHQVCDLVEMRSGEAGTTVRVHIRRDPRSAVRAGQAS
jgi:anti-sigma regulatory factor (Ser/Thr protein kinase)